MSHELLDLLRSMYHLQAMTIVLIVGLYGTSLYSTIVITRILHDVRRMTQEVLRRQPEQGGR